MQCATRVQAVRGNGRGRTGRSLERASEGPAAEARRRDASARVNARRVARDYDAEAARQPEAAAEPSPAEQKKQQERVTPLMGTALLVALLELFALLENRHWAAATLDPKDHCECWYSCSKTPETKYEYDSDKYWSECWYGSGSWDRDCSCYFDVDVAYDLHGWTVNGRWKEWGEGETALPQSVKGGGCAPCSEGECGTAIRDAFDGSDCSHQFDALVGAAVCLAVAAAVFAALGWPKRFFPDVMLRRRFLGSGLALGFGGWPPAPPPTRPRASGGRRAICRVRPRLCGIKLGTRHCICGSSLVWRFTTSSNRQLISTRVAAAARTAEASSRSWPAWPSSRRVSLGGVAPRATHCPSAAACLRSWRSC